MTSSIFDNPYNKVITKLKDMALDSAENVDWVIKYENPSVVNKCLVNLKRIIQGGKNGE
jgi:hypothetical protein